MHQHPVPSVPHPDDLNRVTAVFKALSEPIRVQLILLITGEERNVTHLAAALNQPQSTVSRHLALLRTAHLVQTRREGTSVYYRLADAHLSRLVREAFSHAQHERLGLPDHPVVNTVTGSMR